MMVWVGVCRNFYAVGPPERVLHSVQVAFLFFHRKRGKMEEWFGCAILQKLVVALHVPDQRNTLGWVW